METTIPVPDKLTLDKDRRCLTVSYDSGVTFELPAEYLRVFAPSADVQGHGGKGGKLVGGKRLVSVEGIEPVGNYAVRLIFSDGHRNGIYTWKTLLSLGVNRAEKWRDYLAALAAAGKSRDRG